LNYSIVRDKQFKYREKHKTTNKPIQFLDKNCTILGYRTMQNWNNWSMNIKRNVNLTPRPGGPVSVLPAVLPCSPGSRESIPGGSKNFISLPSVKTGAGIHPALPFNGYRAIFSRNKAAAA